MKKIFKSLVLVLCFAFLISFSSFGLTSKSNTDKAATVSPSKKPRVKIKFFYGDSGLQLPDGVDRDKSEWVKIIKDYANVDLEIECPPYKDFTTKYQLLLSSGKLPDLIHTWMPAETIKAARQGAFIDLKPYYDRSKLVKKWVSKETMEQLRDEVTGKYYRIPMGYNTQVAGSGIGARYDLIKKHNGGKIPGTIDEWIAFLKVIKKIYPNSTPLTAFTQGSWFMAYGDTFYKWYGVPINTWVIKNGKVVNTFTQPQTAEATVLYRQCYKDGLFDKEWATNDRQKVFQKLENNNWVLRGQIANEDILLYQQYSISKKGGWTDQRWIELPPLKKYPASVDPKYTYGYGALPYYTSHALYISSQSKYPDRAFDVIEALSQDKLYEAIFWGKQGVEYTVKNGKRIPNPEKMSDPKRYWALQLAMVFGWNWSAEVDMATCKSIYNNDADFKFFENGIAGNKKEADIRGPNFMAQIQPIDEISKTADEAHTLITQSIAKTILGQMSISDFKKAQETYYNKYGKRYAELYQAELDKNKAKWKKMGINEVDW